MILTSRSDQRKGLFILIGIIILWKDACIFCLIYLCVHCTCMIFFVVNELIMKHRGKLEEKKIKVENVSCTIVNVSNIRIEKTMSFSICIIYYVIIEILFFIR